MPPRTRRTPYASSAVRTYQPAIVFSFITFNSPKHVVWYLIFFSFFTISFFVIKHSSFIHGDLCHRPSEQTALGETSRPFSQGTNNTHTDNMTILSIAALLLAAAPAAMGRTVTPVGMSFPTDKIVGDQVLLRGQELMSDNKLCKMVFQQVDGNIVRYYKADENDNWDLDTRNGPAGWDISGAQKLEFSDKGNLLAGDGDDSHYKGIRGATINAISQGKNGHQIDVVPAGAIFKAVLGGDCNLVIYVNDDVVWTWNKGDLPSRAADDMCRSDGTWCTML